MKIVRGNAPNQPSAQRSSTFTGEVWLDPILPATDDTRIATVFFGSGDSTFWHSHERGQILQITAGNGLVCTYGERPRTLRAGDIVWVPPGERHWHGATPDSFMTHTAISLGVTQWADEVAGDDLTPVSDEEGQRNAE